MQSNNSHRNASIHRSHHSRSSSPRPTSPLPSRPISPLATGSATAIGDGNVLFQNFSPNLSGTNTLSTSPSFSSFNFPNNTNCENSSSSNNCNLLKNSSDSNNLPTTIFNSNNTVIDNANLNSTLNPENHLKHNSFMMITKPNEELSTSDQTLLRLISDGATRFLHHQLCEICADCLQKSRDDVLMCSYFCNMSVRLDETLAEVFILLIL